MNKMEFLAASLPYGLKIANFNDDNEITHIEESYGGRYEMHSKLSYYKPIIRPLSDLTKECVQADYNDGKLFIPIVELAKIADPYSEHKKEVTFKNQVFKTHDSYGAHFYSENGLSELHFEYVTSDGSFHMACNSAKRLIHNQLQLFQQLLKWHFWPNKPENEEVIYVDENFNPYK